MGTVRVNRVFPEAVAEIEKIMPIPLIFLGTYVNQVISEYPDAGAATAPENYNGRNEICILSKVERMVFQLKPL